MEESSENIVVFESYDTVTAANLVKTKLDAYGIPCFLSDEHFVNLYPIRNELFPGVRLHIFEKDRQRVKEILTEVTSHSEIETVHCPKCHSTNITLENKKTGWLDNLLTNLLLGLFIHPKKVYHCNSCRSNFELPAVSSTSSAR